MYPPVHAGAVDELGDMPYYAEHCAAMLAVTYSSGQGMQRNIVSGYVTHPKRTSTYIGTLCINSFSLMWRSTMFVQVRDRRLILM